MRGIVSSVGAGLAVAVMVAGCAGAAVSRGGGGSLPMRAVAASATASPSPAIGGMYEGSVTDSRYGVGRASLALAGFERGDGGSVVATFGAKTEHGIVEFESARRSFIGTMILDLSNPCTFAVKAGYSLSRNGLAIQYEATHGCSGRSGRMRLSEQCSFVPAPALEAIERPAIGNVRPC